MGRWIVKTVIWYIIINIFVPLSQKLGNQILNHSFCRAVYHKKTLRNAICQKTLFTKHFETYSLDSICHSENEYICFNFSDLKDQQKTKSLIYNIVNFALAEKQNLTKNIIFISFLSIITSLIKIRLLVFTNHFT